MSEEIIQPAAAAPAAEATATPAPAETPAPLAVSGDTPPPAESPPPAPEFTWPEDWAAKLAGEDEKTLGLLKQYKSPAEMAKAFKELRKAFDARKPGAPLKLPENPTEEQVAEYRKAIGVPEKPEDYQVELPEGVELDPVGQVIQEDFLKTAHSLNMPPEMVQKTLNWFSELTAVQQQLRADQAAETRRQTEAELRKEWGGDFSGNVNLMTNILADRLGSKHADFCATELADGSRLGDNPQFIRLMADLARDAAGANAAMYYSDPASAGKSMEQEKADLLAMMNSPDPATRKKYYSDEIQTKLFRITEALGRRKA